MVQTRQQYAQLTLIVEAERAKDMEQLLHNYQSTVARMKTKINTLQQESEKLIQEKTVLQQEVVRLHPAIRIL